MHMAKYLVLIILGFTHLNLVFGQDEDLPLAYSKNTEYLEINGQLVIKTTSLDYTDNKQTELVIWSTETKSNGGRTVTTIGTVEGDTLNQISIQQFDSLDNLILEIDSSNNELTKKNEYRYDNTLLVFSKKYNDTQVTGGLGPTIRVTNYFYEDELLTKSVETQKGESIVSLLYDSEVIETTTTYKYNQQRQLVKEISTSNLGTVFKLVNTINDQGRKTRTDYQGDGFSTWKYDETGNIVEEFHQSFNVTERIEYSYDSLNRLIKELTYLKQ